MLGLRGSPSNSQASHSQKVPTPGNQTTMTVPTPNGHANGHTNGQVNGDSLTIQKSTSKENTSRTNTYRESFSSHTQTLSTAKATSHTHTFTSDQQVTVLRQTVSLTRARLISDLAHVNSHYIDSMTVESFMDYIERERLTHMPRQGSRWDKVLRRAEFFGLQISRYEEVISKFVPESETAAKLIWAACRVLIELGPGNSQALETTFSVFYKVALSLSFFLQHPELLSFNSHIRMEVGQVFNELLILVRDVGLYYRVKISTSTSTEVSVDFNSVFGKNIDAFYRRKDHIIESMWESILGDDSVNLQVIRKWLGIHDSIVQTVLNDRTEENNHRDEYTCEWFQRPLLDFSRGHDDVLAITAASGCGKSFLAGWIIERLQRPLGKKTHSTLSVSIDPEIPSLCSSLSVAKNLALQLLNTKVGDIALLNALEKAYSISLGSGNTAALESELWTALDVGLDKIKVENLVLVIDGVDERCGNHNAADISRRIAGLATKHDRVQAIILTRSATHLPKLKTKTLAITPDHTHHDLQHITEHALQDCQHFRIQNEHEQEAIAEKIAHAARGNFLWVQLIAKSLKLETSYDGFVKAVQAIREKPKSLEELIQSLLSTTTTDFTKPETNLLLSWLLVAERPLTIGELKSLLQVDIQKKTIASRKTDITEDIQTLCGPLVRIKNGIVRFRHGALRDCLLKTQEEGKKLPGSKAAHAELVARLLAHCHLRHPNSCTPAFECLGMDDIDSLVRQDALLKYAIRNWVTHFRKSSLYKTTGHFQFSDVFKAIFPSSSQLARIEWSYWETITSPSEAIEMHSLALRIRQEIFTEKHETVLQTFIICGNLYKKLSNITEAGTCFYRASHIGQSILKLHSTITVKCTTTFLEITETITSTTRTELITQKEELLQYVITAYEHQHGKTSDIVIRYCRTLAELYVTIHEEHKAETIWRKLREIMIIRHGKGSEEETSISGHLNVVLKKGENREDLTEYERNIFETTSEMEIWDIRRIEITLKLAVTYEAHGDFLKAEELYIILWRRLIEYCHHVHLHHVDIDVHISMIDISIEYVRFLRRCDRHEEAAGILICIWTEYEEYDFESEIIFLRLKMVGELMRAISLLSIAVSVFKKCLSWFKSHGKVEHTTSCEVLISETIEEITTTTVTSTTVSTTTTTTETVIKEVFESTISRSTVSTETISVCQSLISFYMKSEKWSEAITTSTRSLELVWRMILSGGGTIALPRDFGSEAVDIAIQLAICHLRLHHFHESESIYVRIYRACLNSCKVQDDRFTKIYATLIKFYEEHGHWHKVVEIHRDVLTVCRKQLGSSHTMTIKTLYLLASICSERGHGHAHEYYEEIITVLNGNSHTCHKEALPAMTILCRIYFEMGHWKQLKHVCEILWETWSHHHHEHKFEADFIELLYMRYIYVLEHHSHAGYEILRTITIQFRETCVKVFGVSVAISIRSLIELAQICMRSEKHVHEAISHYEEVIKTVSTTTTTTTTTVVSTTTISTVKERLTKAYIHVCTHGTASSTTIERAITVILERFEFLKVSLGCSHTETLSVLRELVLLYWKLKTKESHSKVVGILRETIVLIISKEKHSRTLYDAARSIGNMYVTCGLLDDGRKVLQELHQQIISKIYTTSEKSGFKIDQSVGKGSYVFLVTFEGIIQSSTFVSYSKVMADLLTETILYESYTRTLKSETNIEVILVTGARFYEFLVVSSRKEQATTVQETLFKIFHKKWGSIIKTHQETTKTFFISLLRQLGSDTRHQHIDNAAWTSTCLKVHELLSASRFQESYDLALCAFQFITHQNAFHQLQNIGYGFKLSGYMALRGLSTPFSKPIEPELRTKMLALSRQIIGTVFKVCKETKINFVRLKLGEINDLVALLGEQENYADLEWLLNTLWSSREVQKTWSPDIIISLSARLIAARFLSSHPSQAISLAETVCYNLRRVWGSLDPKTLDMYGLSSRVYTAAGHHREAMGVHEDILRLVVEGDDGDDRTLDTMPPETAIKHLKELKRTYQRLGGWDKSAETYKELVDQLLAMPVYKNSTEFKGEKGVETWNVKEKPEKEAFKGPSDWGFVEKGLLSDKGELVCGGAEVGSPRRGGLRRVSSHWGALGY